MSYIWRQLTVMKKSKAPPKPYKLNTEDEILRKVEEPYVSIPRVNKLPAAVSDFSYKKFEKIADKIPFSLADWAQILHLSERTLQRYAKDNKNFEGIYVDRIFQIDKLINLGLAVFTSADGLYNWLKQPKMVMGQQLSFEALYHTDGIHQIIDQLSRIQQGVYA